MEGAVAYLPPKRHWKIRHAVIMVRPRKESQTVSPRLSTISARFLRDGTPFHHPVADRLVQNIRALPTEALTEEPSPNDARARSSSRIGPYLFFIVPSCQLPSSCLLPLFLRALLQIISSAQRSKTRWVAFFATPPRFPS